jgi:hypothetical protein
VFSLANCSRRLSDLSGIVVLPSTEITKWSFKTSTIRLPFEKKKNPLNLYQLATTCTPMNCTTCCILSKRNKSLILPYLVPY